MSIREVTIQAQDKRKGMTVAEIREAIDGMPPSSHPKVISTWGGKIHKLKFLIGGFGQAEADRGKI
jgi:hypothetical protein